MDASSHYAVTDCVAGFECLDVSKGSCWLAALSHIPQPSKGGGWLPAPASWKSPLIVSSQGTEDTAVRLQCRKKANMRNIQNMACGRRSHDIYISRPRWHTSTTTDNSRRIWSTNNQVETQLGVCRRLQALCRHSDRATHPWQYLHVCAPANFSGPSFDYLLSRIHGSGTNTNTQQGSKTPFITTTENYEEPAARHSEIAKFVSPFLRGASYPSLCFRVVLAGR